MAKVLCKMCGGELSLPDGVYSGSCPYCGTLTTFPKLSSDQLEQLYNRAEHFRRINEYDKAVAAYEKIVEVNPDDPEAYWGLVISKFGIEYVEDPVSRERIPTCHRVQFESILADHNYLSALEKAGSCEKALYEAEAKRIAEIQRGILSISNNEQPFDVFICYKESDNYGRRTKDSVTAQEIYYQLTDAGYKVFFSRITLESKLGQQYEPYIFAALNSAKVMLVIGSQKDYFDAVWVRNEWSRFLALMKNDKSKLLIPCYRDMDAYDIPEALSLFQAQDMGKIGFIQDILHGVKKVVEQASEPVMPQSANNGKIDLLLRRAKVFLQTEEFDSAGECCRLVIEQEPENAWAHFYLLMVEYEVSSEEELGRISNITKNKRYVQARMFADRKLAGIMDDIHNTATEYQNASKILVFSDDRKEVKRVNAKDVTHVKIPHGVTEIGPYAFLECSNLTGVTIPDSVTEIYEYAFAGCSSLESVTIPDRVTYIGDYAFFCCDKLTSVTIPDSVTEIGENAFCGCSSLTSVTIPDSVIKIGENAFDEIRSLIVSERNQNFKVDAHGALIDIKKQRILYLPPDFQGHYTIPPNVRTIGDVFKMRDSLTGVTMPESVTAIEAYAFYECKNLSLEIPDSVTEIGECAFFNINSVSVSPGNKNFTVDKYGAVFDKVNKKLLYVPPSQSFYKIPAGIEIIGCGAFGDNLEKVKIPRSVRVIESYAFQSSRLKKVTLTGKGLKIQPFAFTNCKNLKKVVVGIGCNLWHGACLESFPAQVRWWDRRDMIDLIKLILPYSVVIGGFLGGIIAGLCD